MQGKNHSYGRALSVKKPDFTSRYKALLTIRFLIDYLNKNPETKIALLAHIDIYGNTFRNLEIFKQQVTIVKEVVLAKGIATERVIAFHHGGAQTLIRYKNGGTMNRRIEEEILCDKITK